MGDGGSAGYCSGGISDAATILGRLAHLELDRTNTPRVDTVQILDTLFRGFHPH